MIPSFADEVERVVVPHGCAGDRHNKELAALCQKFYIMGLRFGMWHVDVSPGEESEAMIAKVEKTKRPLEEVENG